MSVTQKSDMDLKIERVFCVVFCLSLFVFRGIRAAQSLVFCLVFCLSLIVLEEFVLLNL
jgi:hypothetical protein